MEATLAGKFALVAGATRGAGRGIAVQLGAAGATVYVTGRTTRSERSEMNRPETIEDTAALVDEAGGRGIAVLVDHLVPDEVSALVTRIEDEQGRLHVLVNDIWGATKMEWNRSVWESSLDYGLQIYGYTDLDGSQPDAWRYVTEVQDAGKPADVTGYR
jgi:NAD(P)-dependent dehydrogenase (short-subunit alcohol dehydrogenase family)